MERREDSAGIVWELWIRLWSQSDRFMKVCYEISGALCGSCVLHSGVNLMASREYLLGGWDIVRDSRGVQCATGV